MVQPLWPMVLLCLPVMMTAQQKRMVSKEKNRFADSATVSLVKEDQLYELPIITLNETERSESNGFYIPSLLSANRDVLVSAASFHFSVTRFRLRGYSADQFSTQINGMQMNNPDDGNTQWNLWSGLNDVTRNTQMVLGLHPSDAGFGNMGSLVSMDMRASKQRLQTQWGYALSNRTFSHRWSFSTSTGMNRKGWAISVAGSLRTAEEGYFPGTTYNGMSYYFAMDKQLGEGHLLSLIFFGAVTANGRQAAVLKESVTLAGTHSYNPYWGYQSGTKRNANMGKTHQPVLILADEYRVNNHTTIHSTIGFVSGEKSSTTPDWYHASDPRPDYYRYLPSYQKDTGLIQTLTEAIGGQESLRQINWDQLYEVNRNSIETVYDIDGIKGAVFTGKRSHFILEERVNRIQRAEASFRAHTKWKEGISFAAGGSLWYQQSSYFKRVGDLLGGEYYADWNQFAENNTGTDEKLKQNDLNHPNRILREGDMYGYSYGVTHAGIRGFAQIVTEGRKIDFFAALEISSTGFYRDGKMRNGLFPFHSFGRSAPDVFNNYAVKTGITRKMNGRNYFFLQGGLMSKAPLFDNVYTSPRTRNTKQDHIANEKTAHLESGYILNAPFLKLRWSNYLTAFTDGMNVLTFYHDSYQGFVNYALTGINKIHVGSELGTDIKMSNRLNAMVAVSVGRYYYSSRQYVSVTADADAYPLEKGLVYAKNFRVEGTPQEAYGLGVSYQSQGALYVNLHGNYFRQQWLAWNPLRRTYAALENVGEGSELWHQIIDQLCLPDQYTVDISAGGSVKLKIPGSKHRCLLVYNLIVNNLLNKKDLVSGGYEQLRFDAVTKQVSKFPPKYYYAMGLNFSFSISLRL